MTFRLASDGGTNGDEWIVADGRIERDTSIRFRTFINSKGIRPGSRYEVFLSSPGGNLLGGVQLGELIREFGFGTKVARSVATGRELTGYKFEQEAPGLCYSACSFAFLGGMWRVAADRTLGVHQHYLVEALLDPLAKRFTGADFSAQQVISGILADFVVRMGVDARFLTRAAVTPAAEMYTFSSEEMKRFNITWRDLEYTEWTLEPIRNGILAISKTRNGENIATLFCRGDRRLTLSISSPARDSTPEMLARAISGATVFLFGMEIPKQDISGKIEKASAVFDFKLPPKLNVDTGKDERMGGKAESPDDFGLLGRLARLQELLDSLHAAGVGVLAAHYSHTSFTRDNATKAGITFCIPGTEQVLRLHTTLEIYLVSSEVNEAVISIDTGLPFSEVENLLRDTNPLECRRRAMKLQRDTSC